jgi:hypothetical protein
MRLRPALGQVRAGPSDLLLSVIVSDALCRRGERRSGISTQLVGLVSASLE